MAMFSNNPKEGASGSAAETFIGPSVKMEGVFSGDGDVVIEGILTGTLVTKGDVRIGQNAIIEAELRSKNAYIAGKVKGNLTITNLLKLAGTAIVIGDVKTTSLGIDEGAVLNGKLIMSRDKSVREAPPAERHPEEQVDKPKS